MDLISGYLTIVIVLFTINIALMLGNYKINNIRLLFISLAISAFSFIIMYCAGFFKNSLSFLLNYFNYFFIVIAVVQFLIYIYYYNDSKMHLKSSISFTLASFFMSIFLLSSQLGIVTLFNDLLFSIIILIIIFGVYQISKLLIHAKREYPVVIGEYICLSSILMFIFGLTYYSTLNLDYSMFSSFLILTPTYQLIYLIIALVLVLIMGSLYNDKLMKGG